MAIAPGRRSADVFVLHLNLQMSGSRVRFHVWSAAPVCGWFNGHQHFYPSGDQWEKNPLDSYWHLVNLAWTDCHVHQPAPHMDKSNILKPLRREWSTHQGWFTHEWIEHTLPLTNMKVDNSSWEEDVPWLVQDSASGFPVLETQSVRHTMHAF